MNDFYHDAELIDHIIAHNEPMPLPKLLAELERLVSAVEAR
jgi:hypothetical protein